LAFAHCFAPQTWLVGGFNHLEQSQSMGRIIPYIMGKKVPNQQPDGHYNGSSA
jgi:hypothetical protein